MMIRNEVFQGGVTVSADVYDLATNTYSREVAGQVVETRPMTADEITAYTPAPVVKTAEEKLADARLALAQVATLEAPILSVDVLEVLTDLATALED